MTWDPMVIVVAAMKAMEKGGWSKWGGKGKGGRKGGGKGKGKDKGKGKIECWRETCSLCNSNQHAAFRCLKLKSLCSNCGKKGHIDAACTG